MADAQNPVPRPPGQPFTFGGVARYAYAGPARLLVIGLFFALVCGAVMATLFTWRWAPVIGDSIAQLPSSSIIRAGYLEWPGEKQGLLGANPFVSFAVSTAGLEESAPVDVAFQFERSQLNIRSVLGVASIPYPKDRTLNLNRAALQPVWGAWENALVPLLIMAAALGVMISWFLLAAPYAVVVRVLAAILGKQLTLGDAWKLCVAAQWPGALLLSFALALYAAGETTLLLVLGAFAAHFLLTFFYLLVVPFFLPRVDANPFASEAKKRRSKKNPFEGN